ncbi:MAG TPA: DRTGG domain-containing protein [Bacillota bacterium]|jgi:predicted transcriptional regulator|nr:DRTGG domain-containing protein [Bacillota bacterium]
MKLMDVKRILQAEVIFGEQLLAKIDVMSICGSDLMSDVLAFTKDRTLLLTGLVNPQVIRTAEMIDLVGIVFVRGKRPSDEMVQMAKERNLPLLAAATPLYETCGLLYSAGLPGCSMRSEGES